MHSGRLAPGTGDIVHVRPGVEVRLPLRPTLSTQFDNPVAQRTQEGAIVRDEQHRAIVVVQRVDEHFLREEIEVIGRFIEHQEIRRVEQHARDHQARLLATRKRPNLLVDVVA